MPAKLQVPDFVAPVCPYCNEEMDRTKFISEEFGLIYYRCFCDGYCETEDRILKEEGYNNE